MNVFGIITTLVYMGIILVVRWSSLPDLATMPLNEFGDFFAGVFGPLMLFWLILGYIQQQRELSQNTAALELQAEELKNAVEQNKELVKATREQAENERLVHENERLRALRESQPLFAIKESKMFADNRDVQSFRIIILNSGAPASSVRVTSVPVITGLNNGVPVAHMETGSTANFTWNIQKNTQAPELIKLAINCLDSTTRPYEQVFALTLDKTNVYHLVPGPPQGIVRSAMAD